MLGRRVHIAPAALEWRGLKDRARPGESVEQIRRSDAVLVLGSTIQTDPNADSSGRGADVPEKPEPDEVTAGVELTRL